MQSIDHDVDMGTFTVTKGAVSRGSNVDGNVLCWITISKDLKSFNTWAERQILYSDNRIGFRKKCTTFPDEDVLM